MPQALHQSRSAWQQPRQQKAALAAPPECTEGLATWLAARMGVRTGVWLVVAEQLVLVSQQEHAQPVVLQLEQLSGQSL
ncbi:hypothetical protein [Thermogutta sp.]|uniref:hypothetical protein n=1 Tax=Thermogutta sp. TaxID=1962930 RepID=UPI0032204580